MAANSKKNKSDREFTYKKLNEVLKKSSERIKRETFALGLPITVGENGYVVQIYPDGRKVILEKMEQLESKIKAKRITLTWKQ